MSTRFALSRDNLHGYVPVWQPSVLMERLGSALYTAGVVTWAVLLCGTAMGLWVSPCVNMAMDQLEIESEHLDGQLLLLASLGIPSVAYLYSCAVRRAFDRLARDSRFIIAVSLLVAGCTIAMSVLPASVLFASLLFQELLLLPVLLCLRNALRSHAENPTPALALVLAVFFLAALAVCEVAAFLAIGIAFALGAAMNRHVAPAGTGERIACVAAETRGLAPLSLLICSLSLVESLFSVLSSHTLLDASGALVWEGFQPGGMTLRSIMCFYVMCVAACSGVAAVIFRRVSFGQAVSVLPGFLLVCAAGFCFLPNVELMHYSCALALALPFGALLLDCAASATREERFGHLASSPDGCVAIPLTSLVSFGLGKSFVDGYLDDVFRFVLFVLIYLVMFAAHLIRMGAFSKIELATKAERNGHPRGDGDNLRPEISLEKLEHVTEQLRGRGLTEREACVLAYSAEGASLATIAADLGISRSTAGTYRQRAYQKLEITTRSEARELIKELGSGRSQAAPRVQGGLQDDPESVRQRIRKLASDLLPYSYFTLLIFSWLPHIAVASALAFQVASFEYAFLAIMVVTLLVPRALVNREAVQRMHVRRIEPAALALFALSLIVTIQVRSAASLFEPARHVVPCLIALVFAFAACALLIECAKLIRGRSLMNLEFSAISAVASVAFLSQTPTLLGGELLLCILVIAVDAHSRRLGDGAPIAGKIGSGQEDSGILDSCEGASARRSDERRRFIKSVEPFIFRPHSHQAVGIFLGSASLGTFYVLSISTHEASALFFWNDGARSLVFSLLFFEIALFYGQVRLAGLKPALTLLGIFVVLCALANSSYGDEFDWVRVTLPAFLAELVSLNLLIDVEAHVLELSRRCGVSARTAFLPLILIIALGLTLGPVYLMRLSDFVSLAEWESSALLLMFGLTGLVAFGDAHRTFLQRTVFLESGDEALIASLLEHGLTPAESRVAALLGQGMSIGAVAVRLSVEQSTIKTHRRSIYAKFGVHSRAELEQVMSRYASERLARI